MENNGNELNCSFIEEECPKWLLKNEDENDIYVDKITKELKEEEKVRQFVDTIRSTKELNLKNEFFEVEEGKMFIQHQYKKEGHELFYYHLKQKKEEPKGIIFVFHGFGSAIRIEGITPFNVFGKGGYDVIGFDQETMGRNAKREDRCYVTDYRSMVENGVCFIREILCHREETKKRYQGKSSFLYGFSMGGAIALLLSLKESLMKECNFKGVIAHSPAIGMIAQPNYLVFLGLKLVSSFFPGYKFGSSDKPVIVEASNFKGGFEVFKNHPDSYADHTIRLAMGRELVNMGYAIIQNYNNFTLPLLLQTGTKDNMVDYQSNVDFFLNTVEIKDKTFVRHTGMLHTIISDYCAIEVWKNAFHWVNQRTKN